MQWTIFIAPVVGGAIGYLTNFIAIKMLFHPHKAVHIGKWKLPLTPGLIPKEQGNIARSIGEVISQELLNADTLRGVLTSEETVEKVRGAMKISNALLKLGIDKRDKFFGQITGAFGGELRSIICGGAPIAPEIIKDFNAFGICVLEGYGITECAPLVAVNRPGEERYHSVGRPVPGCEVRIDKTEGEETGEILVKGNNVMIGYYKNEEATRDAFTDDGWFRTGDIGYLDSDGYIYITGRKKNVIILSNGKNVFPEEVEGYLYKCDLINECVVIGRENANGEIVITAVVYPEYEKLADKSADEIHDIIKEQINVINRDLPSFKQVREVEIRDVEFEKTTSKKIKRFLVK